MLDEGFMREGCLWGFGSDSEVVERAESGPFSLLIVVFEEEGPICSSFWTNFRRPIRSTLDYFII